MASLACGVVDQGEPTKRSSQAVSASTDPVAAVGADDPAAAVVPIVTPEPLPQPGANTNSSAAFAGTLQPRVGEATRPGDTRARRESTAASHKNRSYGGATGSARHNNPSATRPRPPPPPPVACTLVAFEPGSLGLELEAIVDEEAKMAQRGEKYRDQRRGRARRPPRRLGCRVFRVTPDGQAARHGSVHPGDALVVLDG